MRIFPHTAPAPFVTGNPGIRGAYRVSMLALLALLAGAVAWYRQRMLFVDPAQITFVIIQKGDFAIPEHRYGAFITQIVPLICTRLHASLRTVLLLYSASFYVFYTLVALVVGRYREQRGFAILLVLYLTLMVSDVYFWPNNEVHQGVAWMILFLGCFFHQHTKARFHPVMHLLLPAMSFLAVFSHFIVIVPFSFLWVYTLLADKRHCDSRRKALLVAAYSIWIAGLVSYKYWLSHASWYDGEKLGAVSNLKFSTVFHAFVSGQAKSIVKLVLKNYWLLIPVFIAGQLSLLKARKYRLAALTCLYIIGYFVLICITYENAFGRELLFYMESEWMALGIIVAAPFVLHWLPQVSGASRAIAVMAVIYAVRLVYIYGSYRHFDERLERISSITASLRRAGIHKALLVAEKAERDRLFTMDWGTPLESMMLSQMQGDRPQITFKVIDPQLQPKPEQLGGDVFWDCFSQDSVKMLNRQYFTPDSVSAYKVLPLAKMLY